MCFLFVSITEKKAVGEETWRVLSCIQTQVENESVIFPAGFGISDDKDLENKDYKKQEVGGGGDSGDDGEIEGPENNNKESKTVDPKENGEKSSGAPDGENQEKDKKAQNSTSPYSNQVKGQYTQNTPKQPSDVSGDKKKEQGVHISMELKDFLIKAFKSQADHLASQFQPINARFDSLEGRINQLEKANQNPDQSAQAQQLANKAKELQKQKEEELQRLKEIEEKKRKELEAQKNKELQEKRENLRRAQAELVAVEKAIQVTNYPNSRYLGTIQCPRPQTTHSLVNQPPIARP